MWYSLPPPLFFLQKQKENVTNAVAKLIQRSDDTEAVITKRLKVYHEQTAPLIEFYTKQKLLHTVNCDLPKDKVFSQVIAQIPPK